MPAHCVYHANQAGTHITPQIQIGDMFCVDCPADGVCPGTVGQPAGIRIRDRTDREVAIRATLQNAACTDCPPSGATGFSFAPAASGGGGFL